MQAHWNRHTRFSENILIRLFANVILFCNALFFHWFASIFMANLLLLTVNLSIGRLRTP